MSWKNFFAGVTVGFAAAYVVKTLLNKQMISSEKALSLAKTAFQQYAPISGSWIQTKPEPYKKNNIVYTVYKGGVCRGDEQHEFLIDAYTGTIIETRPI
ncbi:PepSY domain-containing protein [Thermaerobacillus caldiproteolyticus]|uniref:Putative small secreted protein n=1 Tax=Thermaerobacillus caldiproteolyticus TaxID=247480 RepID=A0A7V9Z4E2_9BACL|nr:PepSY domain-containing protein [Anoxybacillus caldiproteolyticus]MBA2873852.1 putative small secreted protein [Anoxybacillus caldiproteolyticus]QPA30404.1 PepSY domain-containing protein [Anoxybacillus caldiproteolyticus]